MKQKERRRRREKERKLRRETEWARGMLEELRIIRPLQQVKVSLLDSFKEWPVNPYGDISTNVKCE